MSLKQSADTVAREIVENWASSEPYEWAGQSHAALQSAIADTLGRYAEALDVAREYIGNETAFKGAFQSSRTDALIILNAILSPVPEPVEMEDAEIVRWGYEIDGGYVAKWGSRTEAETDNPGKTIVRFATAFQRPKVKPVVKSVSGEVTWDMVNTNACPLHHGNDIDWPSLIGKTGTMTFTWTEPAK